MAQKFIDSLEGRQMLAWGPYPQLIDQDLAVEKHPEITGEGVVVVVIDTGVDVNHPQLQGVLWTNTGEIPGDRIDNDRNGWIDDYHGYDFFRGDGDPNDENSHGTQMAGLIAGKHYTHPLDSNEYQGIAPGAKVISLKIADGYGRTNGGTIERALRWIEANHARFDIDIVSMSLRVDEPEYKSTFQDEIARLGAAGLFMVASAGHWPDHEGLEWPAMDENVFAAGMVMVDDRISPLAQKGPEMDVLAPSKNIPILHKGSAYLISGEASSYPPPFVAGAAALLKQIKPSLTAAQLGDLIRDSGARVVDTSDANQASYPRLDLDDMIERAMDPSPPPPPPPTQRPFGGKPFSIGKVIQAENFDQGDEGVAFNESGEKVRKLYRRTAVGIRKTTDRNGGFDVTGTKAGEWLEYTLDVKKEAVFTLQLRLLSTGRGGSIRLQVDGKNVGKAIGIAHKSKWQTVSRPKIRLTAGEHVVRIVFAKESASGGVAHLNWFKFV